MRTTISIIFALLLIGLIAWVRPRSVVSGLAQEQLWAQKTLWNHQCDIVFAGDSRTYRSLSPAVFSNAFPGSHPCNFGFSGNGYGKEYLDNIPGLFLPTNEALNPRIVMLGITPASLTRESALENDYLTYAHQSLMERYMMATFGGFLKPFNPLVKEKTYRQHFYADGWVASYPAVEKPEKALRMYRKLWARQKVSEKIIANLLQSVRVWRQKGVIVYGFEPPTSLAMRQLEHTKSGFNPDTFKSRFEEVGGRWLDVPLNYHSYDGSHLTQDSALHLSADLVQILKAETPKQALDF